MKKSRSLPVDAMTNSVPSLRSSRLVVYLSFFLSGAAGLGYEIVWTRQFSVGLGHEYISVLAVVGAFFGGIALGAWSLDGVISRSTRPGVWYAALEATVGLWALVTIWLIPFLNDQVALLTGTTPSIVRHWLVAFGIPGLALLPATMALGATLPAIDRLCSRLDQQGRSVSALYAVNTLGAVVGVLLATYVLVPTWGYQVSTLLLVSVSLTCTALIATGPARLEVTREDVVLPAPTDFSQRRLFVTLLLTGLLGIAYEVLCVRVMTQALQNTVYSFSSLLAVYLIGTAVGAAIYHRVGRRYSFRGLLTFLLYGLALSCGIGMVLLRFSREIYDVVHLASGGEFGAAIAAEMSLATVVFLVPTLLMGATFSHLALAARRRQGGVGLALGLNTLGSMLAPILIGALLYSAIGAKWTIFLIATSYLLLLPVARPRFLLPVVAVMCLFAIYPPDLILIPPKAGRELVVAKEGLFGTVAVMDDGEGRRLQLNGHFQMGGTGPAEYCERRQAHVPLLLHPDPKQALFLGLGTGVTFATMADYPGVEADGVELIPEVVEVMPEFGAASTPALTSPQLNVIVADARRFVAATDKTYDVIVGDLFHPARDGAASLYTVEHFEKIRQRLNDGGLFCQWLPMHQIDDAVLRTIIRSYLEVFPNTRAFWAYFNVDAPVLGLVGSSGDLQTYHQAWVEQRIRSDALRQSTEQVEIRQSLHLLGCYVASAETLREFAGPGPLNTDDHPHVLFQTPIQAYTEQSVGISNSEIFLRAFQPTASEIVGNGSPQADEFESRVDDYLRARDLYLQGSLAFASSQLARGIEFLLESVQASQEFSPSYDALMTIAQQGVAASPAQLRQFLLRIEQAAPTRPEAVEMRRWLESQMMRK